MVYKLTAHTKHRSKEGAPFCLHFQFASISKLEKFKQVFDFEIFLKSLKL